MQAEEITAVILCGGGGQRLGGIDKPLLRVGRRTLVEYVIERLRPQASSIILSVGRNLEPYRDFGCELVLDAEPGQGPLGGLVSCFAAIDSPWYLCCPADAPRTAPKLAQALSRDARSRGVAVAHDGHRRQNLTLLINRENAQSLAHFYHHGGRAVHRWLDATAIPPTDLSAMAPSFTNINTPTDLEDFRRSVTENQPQQ